MIRLECGAATIGHTGHRMHGCILGVRSLAAFFACFVVRKIFQVAAPQIVRIRDPMTKNGFARLLRAITSSKKRS
eukprot:scaffold47962_cov24-Attheya_sp.AAC.1